MVVGAHERPERCGSRDSARAEASPGTGTRYAANACSTMMLLRGLSWPATASSLPASSCTLSAMGISFGTYWQAAVHMQHCLLGGPQMQWLCHVCLAPFEDLSCVLLPKAGSALCAFTAICCRAMFLNN